jgi:hypothetical protein
MKVPPMSEVSLTRAEQAELEEMVRVAEELRHVLIQMA